MQLKRKAKLSTVIGLTMFTLSGERLNIFASIVYERLDDKQFGLFL